MIVSLVLVTMLFSVVVLALMRILGFGFLLNHYKSFILQIVDFSVIELSSFDFFVITIFKRCITSCISLLLLVFWLVSVSVSISVVFVSSLSIPSLSVSVVSVSSFTIVIISWSIIGSVLIIISLWRISIISLLPFFRIFFANIGFVVFHITRGFLSFLLNWFINTGRSWLILNILNPRFFSGFNWSFNRWNCNFNLWSFNDDLCDLFNGFSNLRNFRLFNWTFFLKRFLYFSLWNLFSFLFICIDSCIQNIFLSECLFNLSS